jgi:hypothetical protein
MPQPGPQGRPSHLSFNPNTLNQVNNFDHPVSDARSRNVSSPKSQAEMEQSKRVYTPPGGDVDIKSKADASDPNLKSPKNKKKTISEKHRVNEAFGNIEHSDISSNSKESISPLSDDGSHGKSSSDEQYDPHVMNDLTGIDRSTPGIIFCP